MTLLVDIVSVLATITGFLQLLSPLPDTRRILNERSTGVVPLVPLVSMLTVGWIWTTYGILDNDIFPLAITNGLNVCLSTTYISIYYRFTPDRSYAHKVFLGFALVIAVITVYAALGYYGYTNQSRHAVKNVMGYLGNVVVLIFFVAPFENVAQVFRHRSGAFIPIMIVLANILNGTTWLTYSLLVTDWFILVPNACSLVIGSIQVAVYLYFHPSKLPLPLSAETSPDVQKTATGDDTTGMFKSLESPVPVSRD